MKKRLLVFMSIAIVIVVLMSCSNAGIDKSMELDGAVPRLLIPANAEIVSAELYLFVTHNADFSKLVDVHRSTSPWEEYSVIWDSFNNAYSSDVISTETVVDSGWQSFDIKPYIESWLNGEIENYGLLLMQQEPTGIIVYHSKENSYKPYIQLTYIIAGNELTDEPEVVSSDTYIRETYTDNFGADSYLITGPGKQVLIKFDLAEEITEVIGTGTPGYWKNHPEAWPAEGITIGSIFYTKEEAIEQMSMPVKKDKWYSMFRTLVAAKLNVLNGCADVVAETITAADEWMETYHHLNIYGKLEIIRAKSDAWAEGSEYHSILDDYNNGLIEGVPHRD